MQSRGNGAKQRNAPAGVHTIMDPEIALLVAGNCLLRLKIDYKVAFESD
jgi:hypothetical protein